MQELNADEKPDFFKGLMETNPNLKILIRLEDVNENEEGQEEYDEQIDNEGSIEDKSHKNRDESINCE